MFSNTTYLVTMVCLLVIGITAAFVWYSAWKGKKWGKQ
jgi:hypothetical protein